MWAAPSRGGGSCSPKTKGHIITQALVTPCVSSARVLRENPRSRPAALHPPSSGPGQARQTHGRARGCHRAPGYCGPRLQRRYPGHARLRREGWFRWGACPGACPDRPPAHPNPGPARGPAALPRPRPLPPGACAARAPPPAPILSLQQRRHVSCRARRAGRRGGAHRRGSGHAATTGPSRAGPSRVGRDHLGGGTRARAPAELRAPPSLPLARPPRPFPRGRGAALGGGAGELLRAAAATGQAGREDPAVLRGAPSLPWAGQGWAGPAAAEPRPMPARPGRVARGGPAGRGCFHCGAAARAVRGGGATAGSCAQATCGPAAGPGGAPRSPRSARVRPRHPGAVVAEAATRGPRAGRVRPPDMALWPRPRCLRRPLPPRVRAGPSCRLLARSRVAAESSPTAPSLPCSCCVSILPRLSLLTPWAADALLSHTKERNNHQFRPCSSCSWSDLFRAPLPVF